MKNNWDTFNITFSQNIFKKGDVLKMHKDNDIDYLVIKVYDKVWWAKILIYLGLKKKSFTIKIKMI